MNKLLLVAAMIMTAMALNLKNVETQKSADFATVSDGMKMMQNAFLNKKSKKNELASMEDDQLLQVHDGEQTEAKALADETKDLKNIF